MWSRNPSPLQCTMHRCEHHCSRAYCSTLWLCTPCNSCPAAHDPLMVSIQTHQGDTIMYKELSQYSLYLAYMLPTQHNDLSLHHHCDSCDSSLGCQLYPSQWHNNHLFVIASIYSGITTFRLYCHFITWTLPYYRWEMIHSPLWEGFVTELGLTRTKGTRNVSPGSVQLLGSRFGTVASRYGCVAQTIVPQLYNHDQAWVPCGWLVWKIWMAENSSVQSLHADDRCVSLYAWMAATSNH